MAFLNSRLIQSGPEVVLKNHHWAPTKRISEAQSSNKPVWHFLPTLFYHTCKLLFNSKWSVMNQSIVCTHLFIISSCFSLASSYLSAKRSAISRKLFLYASEKCLFTLDLHARQVCLWKQDKEPENPSWSREWTYMLNYSWKCIHFSLVSHRTLYKVPFAQRCIIPHVWRDKSRQITLTFPLDSN